MYPILESSAVRVHSFVVCVDARDNSGGIVTETSVVQSGGYHVAWQRFPEQSCSSSLFACNSLILLSTTFLCCNYILSHLFTCPCSHHLLHHKTVHVTEVFFDDLFDYNVRL